MLHLINKSNKRIKYMKNGNIMIKTNIHTQNTCLTGFAIRRTRREQFIQHFLLTH